MQIQNFFAQDVNGNIVPGAECTLYISGTAVLATGLQDSSGNPLTNPFFADSNGLAAFAAPNGAYDLHMISGLLSFIIKVQFIDVVQVSADAASASASATSAATSATNTLTLYNSLTSTNGATLILTSDGTSIQSNLNLKANNGANNDITSLSGLSTPISISQGGTNSSTQSGARTSLGLGNSATHDSRAIISELSPGGPPTLWDDGYVWGYSTGLAAVTGNGNKFNYYQLAILDDEVVQETGTNGASGSKVNGLHVLHIFGGPGAKGGRHGMEANLLQAFDGGPTSSDNLDRNYVGVQGQVLTASGDGGTSTADRRGSYFGISSSAGALGGQYINNLTGCEFNTYIASGNEGTRVFYHSGIQICSDLRQRGYAIDAAFSISNLGGSIYGWQYGMYFNGGNGRHPLDSDSTLIKVEAWGGGMNYGIDLRGHTFTGAPLITDKTTIGDGDIALNKPGATMVLGLVGTASAPRLKFRSGGTASDFDVGISAVGGSSTLGSGIMSLEAGNIQLNGTLTYPGVDNTQALGRTANRFTQVYATTGTINTSDVREKNIKGDLIHGLDVLEKLKTIEYTWKDGGGTLQAVIDGYDDVEIEETEEYEEEQVSVSIIDGKAVKTIKTVVLTRPVFDEYPLFDDKGERVIDEYEERVEGDYVRDKDGEFAIDKEGNKIRDIIKVKKTREATFKQLRKKTIQVPRYTNVAVPREGNRIHFGLPAQQVREVMVELGLEDWAVWTLDNPDDPLSRQGLRNDQFIPLLINAVVELSARVKALEGKK